MIKSAKRQISKVLSFHQQDEVLRPQKTTLEALYRSGIHRHEYQRSRHGKLHAHSKTGVI